METYKEEDKISIIVPVYQVELYLEQCIQSILNQTYRNLEIIFVVKDSGDNCLKICNRYAESDARIKVLIQDNKGLYAARQIGILAATGSYVGFVDSDDWIALNMYEELHRLAVDHNVDVVESGCIDVWTTCEKRRVAPFEEGCYKGKIFDEKITPKLLGTEEFYQDGIFSVVWNKLFKTEAILKYQAEDVPSQKISDDIVCTIPCVLEARSLFITHNSYYYYRVRKGSGKRAVRSESREDNYFLNTFELLFNRMCIGYQRKNQLAIQRILLYYLLILYPFVFDQPKDDFFLNAYGGIHKKDRVILYGAGAAGCHMKHYFDNLEGSHLVCWVDQNYRGLDPHLSVQGPEKILQCNYDWVVISILRASAVQSAKNDLIKLGVPEEKIRWIPSEYIEDPWRLLKTAAYDGERMLIKNAEEIVCVRQLDKQQTIF